LTVISYYDRKIDVLRCRGCGEARLMSTRAIFDQQEYVEIVERFAAEHARCASYHSQDRARRALVWNRLVHLMERAQQRRASARLN